MREVLVIIAGMLSKEKGQILRVAASLHVLFNINTPHTISQEIGDDAVKAAVDLVMCAFNMQHS